LHFDGQKTQAKNAKKDETTTSEAKPKDEASLSKKNAASLTTSVPREQVNKTYGLLGTAIINIEDAQGQKIQCRAILDSASQINIITQRTARKLGLRKSASSLNVNGVGLSNQPTKQRVYASISSTVHKFEAGMEACIMPAIVPNQPSIQFNTDDWPIPQELTLADPKFNYPGPVDVLIGVELYYDIIQPMRLHLGKDLPFLQNSVFGWMVAGPIAHTMLTKAPTCAILTNKVELDLQRYWEQEEINDEAKGGTQEEQQCEEYFNCTVKRTSEGRFVVRLPFKEDPNLLGQSRQVAYQRFLAVERRLDLNPELKSSYIKFMNEYRQLGHMTEIDPRTIQHPSYFLPHHGVIRPESTTTKLRVVFDASATTSKNVSLNDLLATGPTVQDDLFSILTRFRLPKFVFIADIEKMYRQILVDEADRRYQLIFWRSSSKDPIKTFQLNTVTYGTTSAPYLASKCLQRLAQLEKVNHPVASDIVLKDFYVDDVMSGFNSLNEALHAQKDLNKLLGKGGFKLRKWCGN